MAAESNTIVSANASISGSGLALDQEKFLAAQLVKRAHLHMVAASLCDKVKQPHGAGLTAYFVRYNRMNLPSASLTEGDSALSNSTFTLTEYTVTLTQWGDVLALSDVAELTAKHPLMQQATELLADNAARVMDREIQLIWLANTNVQYFNGSRASRVAIAAADTMDNTVMHRARVTMQDNGVRPRGGPAIDHSEGARGGNPVQGEAYVMVCGPQVIADLQAISTSFGSWASVATYSNQKALYNSEVGTWLGIRVVMTNFIPKYTCWGTTTVAVASDGSAPASSATTLLPSITAAASGGSIADSTTCYWRVTKTDKQRGFEEYISVQHTTATAGGGTGANKLTWNFSYATIAAMTGYTFNVYVGAASNVLYKVNTSAIEAGTAAVVATSLTPSSTLGPTSPSAWEAASSTYVIHPCYVLGAEACQWVGLQDLKVYTTLNQPTTDNPLLLRRKVGYKFMGKAIVADTTRLLKIELSSAY